MFADMLMLLAAAASPPPKKPIVFPDAAQLRELWPQVTPAMRAGGWATVRCTASREGRMRDCQVVQEYPAGSGFGQVAQAVAPRVQWNPVPAKVAVPVSVTLSLAFSVDGTDTRAVRMAKVENPEWLKKPTAEDLRVVWPVEAYLRGKGGNATISCEVSVAGLLTKCTVASETPTGAGFGAAALALAPQFLLTPMKIEGVPQPGGTVRIPLKFGNFTPDASVVGSPGRTRFIPSAIAWERAPTVAEMRAAFPANFRTAATPGTATLQCRLNARGELGTCDTLAESPAPEGAAQAARSLTKFFRTPLKTDNGQPINGAMMSIPFTFNRDILDPAKPFAGKLKYAKLPTPEELTAAYGAISGPPRTLRAVLTCTVEQKGVLANCSVESETPAGSGFGARALALAPAFRVTTWTEDGLPTVGARIKVPMRYDVPEAGKP